MHSFKTHFASPFVKNVPTAHVFNTAEGWTVYFHSGLFLKSVWHPWVLEWLSVSMMAVSSFGKQTASCDWFTTRLADEFCYGFRYFCNKWRWKWHQWKSFGCFIEDVAFAHHLVAHHSPPPSYPIGVLVVLATYSYQ